MSWRRNGRGDKKRDMTSKKSEDFKPLYDNHEWIVGIDEAGWGPIAGPMVSAAVVLPKDIEIPKFIKDSKKLREEKRKEAFDWVLKNSIYMNFVEAPANMFDQHGAGKVRELSFRELLEDIKVQAEAHGVRHYFTLIDGNYVPPGYSHTLTVVKGDSKVPAISAASIVAKVVRDTIMIVAAENYPEFGWESNKGYATPAHFEAVKQHGATPLHRQNIKRIKEAKTYARKASQ